MGGEFTDQPAGSAVQACPLQRQPVEPTHWIELELLGEDDTPMPHAAYEVRMPDGTVAKGFLDATGFIRITNIPGSGTCQVLFPELDAQAWLPIDSLDARA